MKVVKISATMEDGTVAEYTSGAMVGIMPEDGKGYGIHRVVINVDTVELAAVVTSLLELAEQTNGSASRIVVAAMKAILDNEVEEEDEQ